MHDKERVLAHRGHRDQHCHARQRVAGVLAAGKLPLVASLAASFWGWLLGPL
jgi:hypothetical protein